MNSESSPTVPGPRPLPLIGNLWDVMTAPHETSLDFSTDFHERYGGIFTLQIGSKRQLFASHQELVAEMCSNPVWSKAVHEPLEELRALGGDGLFTAYNEEPNWGRAHRLLMPAFGTMAMKDYFPQMLDIAEQLMVRWERFGPRQDLDVAGDMTRLTLDTIALCAFDVRFNSFYSEKSHPFVEAMVGALGEAGDRENRLPGVQPFLVGKNRKFKKDVDTMHRIADEIVTERLETPEGERPDDLLERMLTAVDPLTGDRLSEENVRYQMATFLIAGHETTSGLLSFATHLLLTHPEVLERARRNVDEVLGHRVPTFEDMKDLGYIGQVLRETLRLYPTAPAFGLAPSEDTTLGGYPIGAGEQVIVLLPTLHRDPAVWADPDRFDPDRFAPERMEQIPEYAWMPFGHGARACIGRPFALQEATVVLAMMLQRFDLALADPETEMKVGETLTLKPENLTIRATARRARLESPGSTPQSAGPVSRESGSTPAAPGHETPMLVLFGSNGGSSESLARTIAGDGLAHGWDTTVAPLDEYARNLPDAGPVVIVTSSYNGAAPDNAAEFLTWVTEGKPDLAGVDYLVLGCGSLDWAATYQQVPTLVDDALHAAGARRMRERGEIDARTDFFGDWERWYQPLWEMLAQEYDLDPVETTGPRYRVVETSAAPAAKKSETTAVVTVNRELVRGPSGRSKRHLELRLPEGVTYRTGDYLSVLPQNHPDLVTRMLTRLGLQADQLVTIDSDAPAGRIPVGVPTRADDLLTRHVDLAAPATPRVVDALAHTTKCPPERDDLVQLAGPRHADVVLEKRLSLLDLVELFPSCRVDLAWVLDRLPAPRARQYSISSAHEAQSEVSLTVSVIEAPARSGRGLFRGAASSHLQRAHPGDRLTVTVASPSEAFRPPADNTVPMVMIAAGSGIAPFRAFIQSRLARTEAGRSPGEMVLFFGCQHPDWDDLYADELAPLTEQGRLRVERAYSQHPDGDIRYVQHRLRQHRGTILELTRRGAHIYVCGDVSGMGPAVEDTLTEIGQDTLGSGWLADLARQGRYATDLF